MKKEHCKMHCSFWVHRYGTMMNLTKLTKAYNAVAELTIINVEDTKNNVSVRHPPFSSHLIFDSKNLNDCISKKTTNIAKNKIMRYFI